MMAIYGWRLFQSIKNYCLALIWKTRSPTPTQFDKIGNDLTQHILGFIFNPVNHDDDFLNKMLISKNMHKMVIEILEKNFTLRLSNLMRFKFEAHDMIFIERVEEISKLKKQKTYRDAYHNLQADARAHFEGHYRDDLIELIGPEILYVIPRTCINTERIYIDYLTPSSVPNGISLAYSHAYYYPAFIFKYHIELQDGTQYDEVRVFHRLYNSGENWVLVGHSRNSNAVIREIEDKKSRESETVWKDAKMLVNKDSPFRQILTQYKRAILGNKAVEPVLVSVQPDEILEDENAVLQAKVTLQKHYWRGFKYG
jgi:hypothetical protein